MHGPELHSSGAGPTGGTVAAAFILGIRVRAVGEVEGPMAGGKRK